MKTRTSILLLVTACILAVSCSSTGLNINTPAVKAQVIGDVEKDLIAGGGALLISGGSGQAAVAAITAQELQNLPELQKVLTQAAKNPPAVPVTP